MTGCHALVCSYHFFNQSWLQPHAECACKHSRSAVTPALYRVFAASSGLRLRPGAVEQLECVMHLAWSSCLPSVTYCSWAGGRKVPRLHKSCLKCCVTLLSHYCVSLSCFFGEGGGVELYSHMNIQMKPRSLTWWRNPWIQTVERRWGTVGFAQEGCWRWLCRALVFPGTSLHVCMYLSLFMLVGMHIVYLAASVLPRCIIMAHLYAACVCVRVSVSGQRNSQHTALLLSTVHPECQLTQIWGVCAESHSMCRHTHTHTAVNAHNVKYVQCKIKLQPCSCTICPWTHVSQVFPHI